MNLVLLLGQLGLSWDFQRERLFPIGTLYDPFVMRALEGIVYSTYSGSRFVLAGTPSGISLSREGGAHQSMITPGIGIETPGPHLRRAVLRARARVAAPRRSQPDAGSGRRGALPAPLDEADRPGAVRGSRRANRRGAAARRRRRRGLPPARARRVEDRVILACCGAIVPEALAAARAARRRGRGRGDRALPLVARPPLPRLAGEHHRPAPRPSRRSHLASRVAPLSRRARPARGHGHRRREPRARLRRRRPSAPATSRSGSTASARPARNPRSTRSTSIDSEAIATACLAALEP